VISIVRNRFANTKGSPEVGGTLIVPITKKFKFATKADCFVFDDAVHSYIPMNGNCNYNKAGLCAPISSNIGLNEAITKNAKNIGPL
jgi:hypothetical protein